LSDGDFNTVKALAFINNKTFTAQANIDIQEIMIYDMAGRLIQTYKNLNKVIVNEPFFHAQAVYIAKIHLTNDTIISVKLINQ
jgi:urate oxidase